jgi:hypothetical protein
MSRKQSTEAFNTAKDQNAQSFEDAQNSYKSAQEDVGNYEDQLSKYAASNPYTKGGEFQTAENRVLADTAGGVSSSLRSALQSSAARTGQNALGANATAKAIADQAERNLGAQQAETENQRIGKEAGYNAGVLSATAEPVNMQTRLYGAASGAAGDSLRAETDAAKTPGFWDMMAGGLAQGLGQGLGGGWFPGGGSRG